MQKTMQRHAAVFRNDELLGEGVTEIAKVYQRMQDVHVTDRSLIWNTDLVETLELDNLIAQAVATMRSEEHTSELQSLMRISYAVFCLKKKKKKKTKNQQ